MNKSRETRVCKHWGKSGLVFLSRVIPNNSFHTTHIHVMVHVTTTPTIHQKDPRIRNQKKTCLYGVQAGRTGSQTAYVDHSHVEHFFLGPVCDFSLDRKAPSARLVFV